MIEREAIKRIADKYQTTVFNVLREYSQNLFLSQLYLHKGSERMLFKGGTALRLIYNSPRFSEDLDFTSINMPKSGIENLLQDVLIEIERLGIAIEINEFSATSGGYIGFVSLEVLDEKLSIELNISQHQAMHKKGEITLISSDFIPAYNLIHLSQRELVNEKIEALLTRAKARDFFDIYFILRSNLLPAEEKKVLYKVLEKLKSKDYNFNQELKIFLPKSHHSVIKDFKSTLQREIEKIL